MFRKLVLCLMIVKLFFYLTGLSAVGGGGSSELLERSGYVRPFGDNAAWNVPAAGLKRHPNSSELVRRLWFEGADRQGNINLNFDEYTYPVYEAADASGLFEVRTAWRRPLNGHKIPWNPKWKPAPGTDAQAIVLDQKAGIEWDLWKVVFDGKFIHARNASRIPGDYRKREVGFAPSRGAGIPYLAMLVRGQEILEGEIRHALTLTVRNTDGFLFVPPATKVEHPRLHRDGIPAGTRYALDITDLEIEEWIRTLPKELPEEAKRSARTIARALRDYGCFVVDSSGGSAMQFESRLTAGTIWDQVGLAKMQIGWKEYPRDLLDGLITPDRLYAIVPSSEYPSHLLARLPERD